MDLDTCSSSKTSRGRRKTRHPLYRGVRQRKCGKWVSEMRDPTKTSRIWLGTFQNPEMAAVAHDVAALALHGDAAALNFPSSAHHLPPPATSSHVDIRRAALKAATDFNPSSSPPSSNFFKINVEEKKEEEDCSSFVDEEAIFNMPLLVDSMAEGMLLTPPAMKRGFNWSQGLDDEIHDFTLWSFD